MATSAQSAGGKVMAVRQREEALARYNAAPKFCIHCGTKIQVPEGGRVHDIRSKKFCDASCAASHNNLGAPRARRDTALCRRCGGAFARGRIRGGRAGKAKFCPDCRFDKLSLPPATTKAEVFRVSRSWQSARSTIQRIARKTYLRQGSPRACRVCGYSTHFEVCHVRPVASFPMEATLAEINAPSNLVALCPTHHWEFDHGIESQVVAGAGLEPAT